MKKALRNLSLLVILVLGTLCLSACGKKEISFNEYVEIKSTGYDGEGTAEITINYSKLMSDYEKDLSTDDTAKTARLFRKIEFVADKSTGLKNGDTVHVEWDSVDTESFAEVGIVPVYSALDLKVEGLKILEAVDVFEGIEITMNGYNGYAQARIGTWPTNTYRYSFNFNLDSDKYYKNGDTVTVEAVPYYDDTIADMASEGVKPASLTYEYKVSGLEEIVEYNPFDYIETSVYGSSGNGYIQVSFKEDAPQALRDVMYFAYEGNDNVVNGGVVKVIAKPWYDTEESLAQNMGIKLTAYEYEVTVEGLEDCLRTISSVPEEQLQAVIERDKATFYEKAGENWAEPESVVGVEYAGSVIVQREGWYGDLSDIYNVYKIDVDSAYDADRYVYWYSKYENVRVLTDGTIDNFDAESYVGTPDNDYYSYSDSVSGEAFVGETGKVYYVGFASIDELVETVAADQTVLENTTADVSMEREPKTSFVAELDYTSYSNKFDTSSIAVEVVGDGTYSITYTNELDYRWSRIFNDPSRLGVVIRNLGEVYNLENVTFSDIKVTLNGEDQKIKQKKVVKTNFIEYPGNTDDAAFYLAYLVDLDEDGNADLSLFDIESAWINELTITFTISGLTEENKIAGNSTEVVPDEGNETPDTENGEETEAGEGTETGDVETTEGGSEVEGGEVATGDDVASGEEEATGEENNDNTGVADNKISYSVTITAYGESKIQAIKVVRDLGGYGLAEAKTLVENAPSVIVTNLSYEEAVAAVNAFAAVGATAEMTEE